MVGGGGLKVAMSTFILLRGQPGASIGVIARAPVLARLLGQSNGKRGVHSNSADVPLFDTY